MEQWHGRARIGTSTRLFEGLEQIPHDPAPLVCGVRSMVASVLRGWLRFYHRLAIVGQPNLPENRSFILIANHASHLDTLCLLAALPLDRLHCAFPAAARDYFCVSALRAFVAAVVVNAVPFDRQAAPWRSLRQCAQLLETPGNILIYFPEGTRGSSEEPATFKPGIGWLAAGRDIPVVPCHVAGTRFALPKGSWWPRPRRVRLTIGAPRVFEHLPPTRDSARHISDELRAAVMALGNGEPRAVATGLSGHIGGGWIPEPPLTAAAHSLWSEYTAPSTENLPRGLAVRAPMRALSPSLAQPTGLPSPPIQPS